jgi:hypothetical protein
MGTQSYGSKPRIAGHDRQVAESGFAVRRGSLGAFIGEETSMTLKTRTLRTTWNAGLLLAVLSSIFLNPILARAAGNDGTALPTFSDFSKTVQNGNANVLRGVYVPDVLALPVVQQPIGQAAYVSTEDGTLTQFAMASQFGTIGLLAHNHLAGRFFSQLAVGQEVRLVYGNGNVEYFVITEILHYRALQPNSPYSSFHNLNKEETLTAEQMFKRVYFGNRHVTFQTCIAKDGNASWGRLFLIATPKPHHAGIEHFDRQVSR